MKEQLGRKVRERFPGSEQRVCESFRHWAVGADEHIDFLTKRIVVNQLVDVKILSVNEKGRSAVLVSVETILGVSQHLLHQPSRTQAEEYGRSCFQVVAAGPRSTSLRPVTTRADALFRELLVEETNPTTVKTPLIVKIEVIRHLCQAAVEALPTVGVGKLTEE
jgi:hypothetical protein